MLTLLVQHRLHSLFALSIFHQQIAVQGVIKLLWMATDLEVFNVFLTFGAGMLS
jgi:hypothetical protein